MSSPPLSVYVVLSCGAAGGGVVKGVTGFGNAIINLLVWVSFTAFGVNGGTLLQAVLADTIGCLAAGIPLLVMTKAHKTADWRLVLTFLVFTTAGSPVGAALLTELNPRWVELVMAVVLLLVIVLHVKLHETAANAVRAWRDRRRSLAAYGLLDEEKGARSDQAGSGPGGATYANTVDAGTGTRGVDADASLCSIAVDSLPSPLPSRRPSLQHPGALDEAAVVYTGGSSACKPGGFGRVSASGGTAATVVPIAVHCAPIPVSSSYGCQGAEEEVAADGTARAGPGPNSISSSSSADGCDVVGTGAGADPAGTVSDTAPLISNGVPGSADTCAATAATGSKHRYGTRSADHVSTAGAVGGGGGDGAASGGSCGGGGLAARFRRWVAAQNWLEMRRILTIGSIAGLASGIMGGMTGIGGPPIMFMYERLQVAKEVVRGTNAVNNVLQARLVTYIVMGVFARSDMLLYLVTSGVGLAGVAVGNGVAGRLDQKGFSRVLVALMMVCCALLFASAAGLKGRHKPAAPGAGGVH